ncbi:hypothetical protein PBT90_11050 [Algoriphagus halophytocola]|uniref:Thioredoxin domain-containing protein n=1 Tax=Algoriphagus halophytocola TaxID=2991499 RepID=A0ABY6MJH9_9BACT|nr:MULTISPECIES: hypothetical protein [unclassified Algoriphagus]UZD23925.1 hypothetical protein OM944_05390 [Algoriphagus sp. TR-M5]WBL41293.1 hypothetical protein PBT90_11050 [Algoriphagus sp. TR-M9]
MKKLILICLLGYLCVPTSTSTAQVADPPGADFLHRSMPPVSSGVGETHRGGDTRPDILSPEIGVVNTDDSVGQGNEKPTIQSPGNGIHLRMEVAPPPGQTPEALSFRLSSHELDLRYDYRTLYHDSMKLLEGQFLKGTMGLWEAEALLPIADGFGRLDLFQGKRPLVQDIWVQPGDSIRISLDQSSGKILFLGPDQDQLRLQVELQDLAAAWEQTTNPIILTSSMERVLDSPEAQASYQEISDNYVPGWNRKMELLIQQEDRLGRARFLFAGTEDSHPVFRELARFEDLIQPAIYDWLWLYWKAKLRMQALEFIYLNKSFDVEWAQLLMENLLEGQAMDRIKKQTEFPMELLESLYLENLLLEGYTEIDFDHLTESLPEHLRQQVQAFFLVRQYKDLADSEARISSLITEVENPHVVMYLKEILMGNLKGKEFMNEPFWNEKGEQVYPESWNGKLVFLDFWLSGCGACMAFAKNKFLPLVEEFGDHPDILFVTITGDSDRELWESTLEKKHFTALHTLDLFAGGVTHPALKQYHIQAFPEQLLLDSGRRILQTGDFPTTLEGWRQLILAYLDDLSSTDPDPDQTPIHTP